MSWNAITTADVLEEFTPQEIGALNNLQGGQENLVPILARVVNAARGSIIAGGNRLGPEGTVPDQLREEIIDVARWRWLISLPQMERLQSRPRQDAFEAAKETLKAVAQGGIRIEVPPAAMVQTAPVNAVATVRRGRRVRTDSFDKLGET
jgi:hypothetical protein